MNKDRYNVLVRSSREALWPSQGRVRWDAPTPLDRTLGPPDGHHDLVRPDSAGPKTTYNRPDRHHDLVKVVPTGRSELDRRHDLVSVVLDGTPDRHHDLDRPHSTGVKIW